MSKQTGYQLLQQSMYYATTMGVGVLLVVKLLSWLWVVVTSQQKPQQVHKEISVISYLRPSTPWQQKKKMVYNIHHYLGELVFTHSSMALSHTSSEHWRSSRA